MNGVALQRAKNRNKFPVSHLDGGLLVIFVVGQSASSQHKVTLLPVLD